jgi:hypothetical protein
MNLSRLQVSEYCASTALINALLIHTNILDDSIFNDERIACRTNSQASSDAVDGKTDLGGEVSAAISKHLDRIAKLGVIRESWLIFSISSKHARTSSTRARVKWT